MSQIKTRAVAALAVTCLLLLAAGCGPKDGVESDKKPPTTESAMNDPRIPAEQKAALEQNIAQQKTSANWVDEKMKANAARKH